MKYTVEFKLNPKGTFSVTDIVADCKLRAKVSAIETLRLCGYPLSDIKKYTVKEIKWTSFWKQ